MATNETRVVRFMDIRRAQLPGIIWILNSSGKEIRSNENAQPIPASSVIRPVFVTGGENREQ